MANTLITPQVIAREALRTLYAQTLMAGLVYRNFDGDFGGQVGDTITVRKPATFTANAFNRASGIALQDTTESSLTITLDTLLDVSFAVTAEELVLRVWDFTEQFIRPATMAIAEKVDQLLLALLTGAGVTANVNVNSGAGVAADPLYLIDAQKLLTDANVPTSERVAVLTTALGADFRKNALFVQAQQAGGNEVQTENQIGRKFGADIYETTNATVTGKGALFHRSAIALVTRTLLAPVGLPADAVATAAMDGLGIRVTRGYDITKKQDLVSLDVLIGTKIIDPARVVKLTKQ